jgi:hypothetical protein
MKNCIKFANKYGGQDKGIQKKKVSELSGTARFNGWHTHAHNNTFN